MKISQFHIREALPEDAPQIASVQIIAWQHAFSHIFPPDKLASLDQEHADRTDRWQSNLSNPDHLPAFFVAETDQRDIVGFCAAGMQSRSEYPYDAELFLIYVLPEVQGNGIGRTLTVAVVEKLRRLGFTSLILWALAENSSARSFYERLGGRLAGEDEYLRWGETHRLVAYGWDSLDDVVVNP